VQGTLLNNCNKAGGLPAGAFSMISQSMTLHCFVFEGLYFTFTLRKAR
jgi:hypothetical protein